MTLTTITNTVQILARDCLAELDSVSTHLCIYVSSVYKVNEVTKLSLDGQHMKTAIVSTVRMSLVCYVHYVS